MRVHLEWTSEWLGPVGKTELDNIIGKIQAMMAMGLDDFPASLLKRQALRDMLTEMLRTRTLPNEWCRSWITFIYKATGDRTSWRSYRPICVTPVLYWVFAQVLRGRIQAWAESEKVLGELQNRLQVSRRLEDIFVLTQCVELAWLQGRQL